MHGVPPPPVQSGPGPRRAPPEDRPDGRRRTILAIAVAAVLGAAVVGAIVTAGSTSNAEADTGTGAGVDVQAIALPDLEGDLGQNAAEPDTKTDQTRADGGCTIEALSIRVGAEGDGVSCLQRALTDDGFYDGPIDGVFADSTYRAVTDYQAANDLFVDGIVGRESAIELGIWPDEESLVVHTPPPPPGAKDSMGFPLSKVATAGDDTPPLPEHSGTGRRVVYDRGGQRVWAVSEDGEVIRSWLVTGSKYNNEMPGTHTVYSRSEMSTAWNGKAWLPHMIRYQKTAIGNIGFHAIPIHVSDNSPYQTWRELGKRMSGGCQRQANEDADFMWAFAQVGTPIVVI